MQYRVGCPREVRVLERQTRLSRLALFEMQHLLRIFGLVSGRANAGRCDRTYYVAFIVSAATNLFVARRIEDKAR